jgi:PhnB protein
MNFYKDCFGGELTFQTGAESPMANDIPPGGQDKIMEARLKIGDFEINGSDMFMDKATVGDNFHIRVKIDDKERFDALFDKLASGGEVFMKPEAVAWGGFEGMVTDRYGIEWGLTTPDTGSKD